MLREIMIEVGAISLSALVSTAFTNWIGLDTSWKIAAPAIIVVIGLLAVIIRLWWLLDRTKDNLQALTRCSISMVGEFSPSLQSLRRRLDTVEERLKFVPGSFATKKQDEIRKSFQQPLTSLIYAIAQLLPPRHDRKVLGAYLKRPVGYDEVEIQVADMRSTSKYNLTVALRHPNSPARRKLEGGSSFEVWDERESVNPVDPLAKEGMVAGSLSNRELLCITCTASGAVAVMIQDHGALLRELLPRACSLLFREYDRYEKLCHISKNSVPYVQKPLDDNQRFRDSIERELHFSEVKNQDRS